tara:strand:+ start:277 stop:843 length:567 start_codon:yes stop_codon:yes gene_type:complete
MADLNKLRQVNPHWKPSESFIKDQEEAKQMAEGDSKPRFTTKEHLNEVHNKLWGEDYYKADEYDGDINKEEEYKEWANKVNRSPEMKQNRAHASVALAEIKQNREMNPSKYTKNEIAQTKDAIKEKILKHFDDALFEMVNEEMGKYYVFQSSNYLTEAGYDMFEDEWFEFYHEHHGDILFQVKTEINM